MLYWTGFTETQWDSLTESGWYYFDIDRSPIFYGGIYGSPKYEDFSSYIPSSSLFSNSVYDFINTGSGNAVYTGYIANTNEKIGRLYKDSGTGYYSGVFTHEFSLINHLPVGTVGLCDLWGISNTIEQESDWNINYSQAIRLGLNAGKLSLRAHQTGAYTNSTYGLASGVPYHIRIIRNNTQLSTYTYDNSSYSGTYVDSLTLTVPTTTYRYFWALNKPNYGSTNTGRISYIAYNYNLDGDPWIANMGITHGLSSETSGVATFYGILGSVLGMGADSNSISGVGTFSANLSIIFASGLDLYIRGGYTLDDYIPLYVSGAYATVGGTLPLYIGCSGVTSKFYLYTKGYGTKDRYYPISDSIPLFIGNPSTTYISEAFPLYLHCAEGVISSGLYLFVTGNTALSSGLDLYISGVGTINNSIKLYTHGY